METQFPEFKLVQVQTEPAGKQDAVPSYVDGELNGDKIPDRVELIQEGNRIGFTLKLGAYQRMVQSGGGKGNPLFGQIAAMLSYKSNTIWEALDGAVKVEQFDLNDFNGDGDTDIRFTIRQQTQNGYLLGVFVLMNQSKPDPELANLEKGEEPQKQRKPEERGREKSKLGRVVKNFGAVKLVQR